MEYQEIQNRVKEILPEKRYEHTLRVVEVAKHLAKVHGANEEKAALAALVHDICKPMDEELMKKYVILHNLDVKLLDYPVEVLHGPVGSAYIEEKFGIADEEVKLASEFCYNAFKWDCDSCEPHFWKKAYDSFRKNNLYCGLY